MGNQQALWQSTKPAAEILDILTKCAVATKITKCRVVLHTNITGIGTERDVPTSAIQADKEINKIVSLIRDYSGIRLRTVIISLFDNQRSNLDCTIQADMFGSDLAQIEVIKQGNLDATIRAIAALDEHFELSYPSDPMPPGIAIDDAAEVREASALRLEAASVKLADLLTNAAERQAESIQQHIDKLAEEQEKRQSDYETRVRSKENELAEAENALKRRESEFDIRAATAVRRESIVKLESHLKNQQSVELSKKTQNKRLPVHLLCMVTLIISATGAIAFAMKILASESVDWHLTAPLTGAAVLFASTLIFYIKWNSSWQSAHMRFEFDNMHTHADVLRANWLAEFLIEWDSEKSQPFPPELIKIYTTGLFSDRPHEETEHPADALAKLVQSVQRARVSGTEVEIERNTKRK